MIFCHWSHFSATINVTSYICLTVNNTIFQRIILWWIYLSIRWYYPPKDLPIPIKAHCSIHSTSKRPRENAKWWWRYNANAFQDWADAWIILYLWMWSFNTKEFFDSKNGYHLHTLNTIIWNGDFSLYAYHCLAVFLIKCPPNVKVLPNWVVFAKIHCQHC